MFSRKLNPFAWPLYIWLFRTEWDEVWRFHQVIATILASELAHQKQKRFWCDHSWIHRRSILTRSICVQSNKLILLRSLTIPSLPIFILIIISYYINPKQSDKASHIYVILRGVGTENYKNELGKFSIKRGVGHILPI